MDDSELEETLKRQVEEWSTNSNECMTIQLIRSDESISASFQPEFTYPIFGDEEAIFGYQGLNIALSFASHSMRPHLAVSYDRKFKAQGEVQATNTHEQLRDFLPSYAFSNEDVQEALKDPTASEWRPPGVEVNRYSGADGSYVTYMADVADPAAREILENMQILVPMFIEGGTALQLEQDWTTERWKIFLTYLEQSESEVPPGAGPEYSRYALVGFGTSYRVFAFPNRDSPAKFDLDLFQPNNTSLLDLLPHPETGVLSNAAASFDNPLKLPSRERLSQFLILPSYHRQNHGQELYNTMYNRLTKDTNVREFTVEDPNEAFDELRDLCDLVALRNSNDDFASLQINTDIPADRLRSNAAIPTDLLVPIALREKLRTATKIMPRQFDRLVEMQTLSKIPPPNRSRNRITRKEKATNEHDKAYYLWRLYVKQRLYIFNRDQLAQVEHQERVEKLESALDSVIEAYEKMIEKVEKREKRGKVFGKRTLTAEANGDEAVEGAAPRKRNRKVIEDDEDESMEEVGEADGVNGHKRARVET